MSLEVIKEVESFQLGSNKRAAPSFRASYCGGRRCVLASGEFYRLIVRANDDPVGPASSSCSPSPSFNTNPVLYLDKASSFGHKRTKRRSLMLYGYVERLATASTRVT